MNFYLSLSLTLACAGFASGDFIKTTFFLSSTKCSGNVYQTVSQLVGCTPQGPKNSLSITCLNSSGATAAVYSTLDCSGPSRSIDVPFDSSCSASGAQSWLTQCVTGSYSALQNFLNFIWASSALLHYSFTYSQHAQNTHPFQLSFLQPLPRASTWPTTLDHQTPAPLPRVQSLNTSRTLLPTFAYRDHLPRGSSLAATPRT